MKESNILAINATLKQLQRVILLGTKEQYMTESNTLAIDATIRQLLRIILLGTKEPCM